VTAAQKAALDSISTQIVSALVAKNVDASSAYRDINEVAPPQPPQPGNESIAIGGITATLEPSGTLTIPDYADPASIGPITLGAADKAKLAGKALSVEIQKGTSAADTVSLAYVHHLRQALQGAGAASVAIDATGLTPTYSSREWFTVNVAGNGMDRNLYGVYSFASTYSGSNFATDGMEIMDSIKVFKHPFDNKPMIVYNRAIKVSDVALGTDNGFGLSSYPFHGLGLEKKGTNGSISPAGSNSILIHGGADSVSSGNHSGIVDFTTYKSLLDEAGLYPSATLLPDHSKVAINAAGGTDANVMSNGMYDFVLAYYNPDKDGNFASGSQDLKARLPVWPASGLAFDGSVNGGVSSRNIGGKVFDNANRKGTTGTSGQPNDNYVGNITVPMANYLVSSLHIPEFKNTNILGDGDKWDSGIVNNYLTLISTNNIGLIGNYSSFAGVSGSFSGITDILGPLPESIGQATRKGYLNIWNNILRETGTSRFNVARNFF
jgi:hypothetical protein